MIFHKKTGCKNIWYHGITNQPVLHILRFSTLNLNLLKNDFLNVLVSIFKFQRLLEKMKSYGIEGQLLKWTRSFLENRTQQVKVNKATSDIADVTSGIPQGSILGPILFTIFINDLPDLVNSLCKIFADDTKCYNHSSKHQILQDDLLSLESWTIKWQLFYHRRRME